MAVEKRFSVSLDVKRSGGNREIEVVEGDNGNIIDVTLTDDGEAVDLTDCRVLAVFSKSNGTSSQNSNTENGGITISGNIVSIALFISSFAPGMVECELQVYSGETLTTLVTTAKFNFKCRRGILNDDTVQATNEYPMLVDLIEQCEGLEDGLKTIDANESTRQTTEIDRQSAEADRAAAESIRASSESARESAESGRAAAESGRIASEEGRVSAESSRVSAESGRASAETNRAAAESDRVTAEEGRASAESLRVSAESGRASAETSRVSAESTRASAESSRASAESARSDAESARASAESSRASAENSRESAETARESASAAAVSAANDATTAANSAADAANAAADQVDELVAGTNIMTTTVYDPNNKAADVFDADNHVSGTTNKVFTAEEQTKLAGITERAEVNVNSDWNATEGDAYIANKPPIPAALSDLSDDATHRLVTDTEKSTWNGKQAQIIGKYGILKEDGEGNIGAAWPGQDYVLPTYMVQKTDASPALGSLASNGEYRCTNLSLTDPPSFSIAAGLSAITDFSPTIIYKSPGTTAPTITNNSGYELKWQGTDVSSGTFSPKIDTVYRLSILFDGIYVNIYVSGV